MALRILSLVGRVLIIVLIALTAIWIGFALWFQLPLSDPARAVAVGAWALFGLATFLFAIFRPSWHWALAYIVALLAFTVWWGTILPSNDRDWATEVEHNVTGSRSGDVVTLENVRNFDWRSDEDFTPHWETRSYDLSTLTSVDLFLGYWSSELIAHPIVSFGFANGDRVAFSAEIRPDKTQKFSTIAGFFRVFTLVLIGADERDIIHLRTNVRLEDVYLFPLAMPQTAMRELFLSFLDMGNGLNRAPKFYNTLTTNCTTVVFRLIRALDPGLPFDYRILLPGLLPSYIFDHQGYQTGLPFEEFRRRAAVSALGLAAGNSPDFSSAIRPPTGLSQLPPVKNPG